MVRQNVVQNHLVVYKICEDLEKEVQWVPDTNDKIVNCMRNRRDVEPMLGQCWADVGDGGPALTRHWFIVCWVPSFQYTVKG